MISKVLILGYYDRQNLGDDMFKFIFGKYFEQEWSDVELMIKNTDDIEKIDEDVDLVICGGGDLINDYFMQKINTLIGPIIHRVPIYALSVGFPYVGLVNDQTLKIFDFVGYRTQLDTNAVTEMYGPNRVQYYPDLAWLLPRWSSKKINSSIFQDLSIMQEHKNEKKVGIFLSNTIRNTNDVKSYNRILNNLAYCIAKMADYKLSSKLYSKLKNKCKSDGVSNAKVYQIYLISFSTNAQNPDEDDRRINADLYSRIIKYSTSKKSYKNVHLIDSNVPVDEILPIFKQFYMTICTRFHAHIFSMIAKVPFISIYSSRKVEDILTSYNLHEYSVKMDTNPVTMHPISIDTHTVIEKFTNLIEKYDDYKNQLDRIYIQNIIKIDRFYDVLGNLIWTPLRNVTLDSANFQHQIDIRIKDIATKIAKVLFPHQPNLHPSTTTTSTSTTTNPSITTTTTTNPSTTTTTTNPSTTTTTTNSHANHIVNLMKTDETRLRLKDLIYLSLSSTPTRSVTSIPTSPQLIKQVDMIGDLLTELIIFNITGERVSEYNYGLRQQILTDDYNMYESIKWILCEQVSQGKMNEIHPLIIQNPIPIRHRKFDMKYFKQHTLDGYHRSGWKYVINSLNKFHNPSGPIFDSFLDKTFGWNYEFYESIGMLPYRKQWTGIFHHTQNETYTNYNLVEVFKKPLFIACLTTCIGLYVLSTYLKEWLDHQLAKLGYNNIKVMVLYHPTEFPTLCFSWKKFYQNYINGDAQVVQVGNWYRNTYAIYALLKPACLTKVALKGRDMDNSYLTDSQLNNVTNTIYDLTNIWTTIDYNSIDYNSLEIGDYNSLENNNYYPYTCSYCNQCRRDSIVTDPITPPITPITPPIVTTPITPPVDCPISITPINDEISENISSISINENSESNKSSSSSSSSSSLSLSLSLSSNLGNKSSKRNKNNKKSSKLNNASNSNDNTSNSNDNTSNPNDNTSNSNDKLKKKCRCHRKRNKYIMGLIDAIKNNHHSVKMIENLGNAEYDTLLSENIVFLNLVDASAANTVIECLVRRTPLVVNRVPAVEEYMGREYPLFYDTLEEANAILNNLDLLELGYKYLINYDISKLHINTFIKDFIASFNKLDL